jgi:hypothetical protein
MGRIQRQGAYIFNPDMKDPRDDLEELAAPCRALFILNELRHPSVLIQLDGSGELAADVNDSSG